MFIVDLGLAVGFETDADGSSQTVGGRRPRELAVMIAELVSQPLLQK